MVLKALRFSPCGVRLTTLLSHFAQLPADKLQHVNETQPKMKQSITLDTTVQLSSSAFLSQSSLPFSPFASKCASRSIFPLVPSSFSAAKSTYTLTSRLNFPRSESSNANQYDGNMMGLSTKRILIAGRENPASKRMPSHTKNLPKVANCQVSYHTNPPPPLSAGHFLMQSSPLLKLNLHKQLRPAPGQRVEWYTSVAPRDRLLQPSLRQQAAAAQQQPKATRACVHGFSRRRSVSAASGQRMAGPRSPVRPCTANIWLGGGTAQGAISTGHELGQVAVQSITRQMGSTTARDGSSRSARRAAPAGGGPQHAIPQASPLFGLAPTLQAPADLSSKHNFLAAGCMTAALPARCEAAHQAFPYSNAGGEPNSKTSPVNVLKTSSPLPRRFARQRGQAELAATQASPAALAVGTVTDSPSQAPTAVTVPTHPQLLASFHRDSAQQARTAVGAASHVFSFMRRQGVGPDSPGSLGSETDSPGWHSHDESVTDMRVQLSTPAHESDRAMA